MNFKQVQRSVRILVLAGSALATTNIYAARIVGNGGVGVWCPKVAPATSTLEILDFYEAHHDLSLPLDLGPATLDEFAKAKLIIDRIAAVDPARGALYGQWLSDFRSEWHIYEGAEVQHFGVINDYGSPYIQDGCQVLQIAVQHQPENPEEPRYLIDGTKWDDPSFDTTQKAGLILHEIIYRDALARGHADSTAAHYLTALYSSKKFAEGMTKDELKVRLRDVDMDAFVNYHNFDDHFKYLYFDNGPMSFVDAKALCSSLSPNADLPSDSDFKSGFNFQYWKSSAIAQKMLAESPHTKIWLVDGNTYDFNTQPSSAGPASATAAVVCWVGATN